MYLAALPQIRSERQLAAIEASLVPHMKPDDAKRAIERHRHTAKPPEEKKPAALALLDGFREAGFAVVHE